MHKFLNYSGTKHKYLDIILPEISKEKTIYIEPFLGSGSVFFNCPNYFDEYIINDKNYNLIRIYKSFRDSSFKKLMSCVENIKEAFGDIKNNKEDYYNFRNSFNKHHWKKDSLVEGFYLWILYGACLNSMPRFGPNGFNQSFGNRIGYLKFTETDFNYFNNKLQNCTIECLDFFELINKYKHKINNSFLFLDPPYIERKVSYDTIDIDFYNNYIEFCKTTNAHFLYTDTDHNNLDLQKIIIRKQMQNISPNRKTEYTLKEIMFKNF